MQDAALTGGAFAVALALVEVIKMLIAKMRSGGKAESSLTPDEHRALMMHLVTDEDGAPIWYTPRSWQLTQKEIAQTLGDISATQEAIRDTLVRLEAKVA